MTAQEIYENWRGCSRPWDDIREESKATWERKLQVHLRKQRPVFKGPAKPPRAPKRARVALRAAGRRGPNRGKPLAELVVEFIYEKDNNPL